jgi:SAM-dependent methyltransferase
MHHSHSENRPPRESAYHAFIRQLFWNLHSFTWDEYLHSTSYAGEIQTICEVMRSKIPGSGIQNALDLGCATGNYALVLAEKGFTVTGIDYAAGMILRARRKARERQIEGAYFTRANFNKVLPFGDSHFELILSAHTYMNLLDRPVCIVEIKRLLAPNGFFVVVMKKPRGDRKSGVMANTSRMSRFLIRLRPYVFSRERQLTLLPDEMIRQISALGFTLHFETETERNAILFFRAK